MFRRFIGALFIFTFTAPLLAQQPNAPLGPTAASPIGKPIAAVERQPLRGLHALEVEVEDVGNIGAACNVNAADLKRAVIGPLQDNSLYVENQSLTPYVYVNVHVVKVNAICVAAVSVSVRDPGLVLITYQQKDPAAPTANSAPEILLWEKESMAAGAADAFGTRVNDAVRTFVTALVADVKQQNP